MTRLQLAVIAAGVLLAAGLTLGWHWFRPEPPKPEPYAPEEVQLDRSRVLERKTQADVRPAHKVPAGAKLERVVRVSVAPKELDLAAAADHSTECPTLDVDLSLVRLPDDTRRVIALSPNGEIIGGVDISVESAAPYKELKWAAGLTVNPLDQTFGGFVDRDMGPFRLGAEINQVRDGFDARLKAGLRF